MSGSFAVCASPQIAKANKGTETANAHWTRIIRDRSICTMGFLYFKRTSVPAALAFFNPIHNCLERLVYEGKAL
jgi:hypothetical protein